MDNSWTLTQVKIVGEGFQRVIKREETLNLKLKVCSAGASFMPGDEIGSLGR